MSSITLATQKGRAKPLTCSMKVGGVSSVMPPVLLAHVLCARLGDEEVAWPVPVVRGVQDGGAVRRVGILGEVADDAEHGGDADRVRADVVLRREREEGVDDAE